MQQITSTISEQILQTSVFNGSTPTNQTQRTLTQAAD